MGSVFRNLRHAVRSLMGDKGFTITVVLTIAVCIAANTATFAVVNSVLLQPLPVPDARPILLMANRYPKAGADSGYNSSSGLAFVLMAGAGLVLASFRRLLHVDPGFDVTGVVTAATSVPQSLYPKDTDASTLMDRTLAAIRAIPGVTAAGATTSIPWGIGETQRAHVHRVSQTPAWRRSGVESGGRGSSNFRFVT
jgi:hypothetical protein